MTPDVLQLAHERSAHGRPCVIATVVWRRSPSSGKPGSKALIDADGTVSGWLGGACAEPAVVREAREALASGEPRLMLLGTAEELGEAREGVVTVPISCHSEGALEVYLEPVLPATRLVAVGGSPAARALAGMAPELGWDALLAADSAALASAELDERAYVVVATQGHWDEQALELVLAARPAYAGLVASRKRAASVLGYLRERGVPEEDLSRVHAPAGLDLGRVAPEEIAVAVMAEIVTLRSTGELHVAASAVQEGTPTEDHHASGHCH